MLNLPVSLARERTNYNRDKGGDVSARNWVFAVLSAILTVFLGATVTASAAATNVPITNVRVARFSTADYSARAITICTATGLHTKERDNENTQ